MNDIIAYTYDFLSLIFEEKDLVEEIKEIILFGSVAKKSYDKKSDIDIFFNIKDEGKTEKIEKKLTSILKSFEIKSEKTWKLKKISFPLNFIAGSLENPTWEALKDEIISSGVLLYGQYKEMPEKISHHTLFYYSLNNIKRKNKMKFIREVFGYSLKKEKKEYKQEGILEKIQGSKLSSNVILIPSQETSKLKKLFNKYKVKYKIMETWIRR